MIKILPTIGPVSDSIKSLRKILKFTDTIRLNGSHNNIAWHVKTSSNVKKIKKKLDQTCTLKNEVSNVKISCLEAELVNQQKINQYLLTRIYVIFAVLFFMIAMIMMSFFVNSS
jgi:pyruvate kinase